MTQTEWDSIAPEYHARGMQPTDAFGYAKLDAMLGNIKNKLVLDYGSGTGKFSLQLAKKGAHVIGMEPSEPMRKLAPIRVLDRSWQEAFDSGVGFFIPFDSHIIDFFREQYDAAVATFVYCTIQADTELETITKNIYKALKPGSRFSLLDPHPDSIGHQFTSFLRKATGQLASGSPIEVHLEGMTTPITDYWRSTEDYVRILTKNGFEIEHITEPLLDDVPSQHYFYENGVILGDELKHPPFIIIQARKSIIKKGEIK